MDEIKRFVLIEITGGNAWVNLAFWHGENFTERLIRKIMKAQEG